VIAEQEKDVKKLQHDSEVAMIAKLKAEKLVERANKVKQVGLAKDALKKK